MKQKVSAPVAIGVTVVVVGAICAILYVRNFSSSANTSGESKGMGAATVQPMERPHSKEAGMALYRKMSGGKQ